MQELKKGDIISIFVRYFLIIASAANGLWIFYKIFSPLTLYPVYGILSLFFQVNMFPRELLLILNMSLEIWLIQACIAGAAYYLLFALNLSIPKIKPLNRTKMIAFAFSLLLVFNISRIVLMSFLYYYGFVYADFVHFIFWYGLSILAVVGIWFLEVKLFKIKQIPVYSDLMPLYKIATGKNKKENKPVKKIKKQSSKQKKRA